MERHKHIKLPRSSEHIDACNWSLRFHERNEINGDNDGINEKEKTNDTLQGF